PCAAVAGGTGDRVVASLREGDEAALRRLVLLLAAVRPGALGVEDVHTRLRVGGVVRPASREPSRRTGAAVVAGLGTDSVFEQEVAVAGRLVADGRDGLLLVPAGHADRPCGDGVGRADDLIEA